MRHSFLKFLADENVPLATVTRLRLAGHEVYWIASESPGIDDMTVWQLAAAQNAILITFDRDFGHLMMKKITPQPRGVVYCRFIPATPSEAADLILRVFDSENVVLDKHFVTLERERLRSRKM